MKSRINTLLLPIALAIILPGLGLYASTGWTTIVSLGLWQGWITASVSLYFLWYVIWYTWHWTSHLQQWMSVLISLTTVGLILTLAYFIYLRNVEGFRWYDTIRIILPSILFIAVQYALRAQQNISQLQIEKEQIQTENYKAQLKAIQAKIDPHFLFNSLNTLRSMVRQQHSNSEKFIISLSDFYRQTLKYDEDTTLPLSEELVMLESYLFLMKSRNEEAVKIELDIDKKLHPFQLPTLSLQLVVENCFKHNSMTSKKPLHIDIYNTEDYYIVVSNNIQPRISPQDSSGYGLKLLRKRYELMSIKHGLIIEESPNLFTIKLKLI